MLRNNRGSGRIPLFKNANFSHWLNLKLEKNTNLCISKAEPACKCHFVCLKIEALQPVQARRNNNPSFAVEKYRKRSNNNDSKFLLACFKKRVVSIQENVHKTLRYVFIHFTSDRVRSECLNLAKFLPRNLHSYIMLY